MHSAIAKMLDFNKKFGTNQANTVYKQMQIAYQKSKQKQVFYPLQVLLNDICNQTPQLEFEEQLYTANALHLFGAWRNTLGIYQLDEHIIKETLKSPIPTDTPAHIFKNLPEWAVYIDLSAHKNPDNVCGFWAVFDLLMLESDYLSLNIIFDTDDMIPINFIIDDNLTVAQSITKLSQLTTQESDNIFEINAENAQKTILLQQALSCLLWLCVAEPDILFKNEPIKREQLVRPKYNVNKKTGTFIPPNEPHFYDIGKRLGGEIRQYQTIIDDETKKIKSTKKRPHIRRGHWHGHWHGTGQAKEFKIQWQPAVFVNSTF